MRGIHWGPVNSPHKWPIARKMFPFDDIIMKTKQYTQKYIAMTNLHAELSWLAASFWWRNLTRQEQLTIMTSQSNRLQQPSRLHLEFYWNDWNWKAHLMPFVCTPLGKSYRTLFLHMSNLQIKCMDRCKRLAYCNIISFRQIVKLLNGTVHPLRWSGH